MTRRGILSAVSSLFDPLGFLSPLVLRAKLLLQHFCRDNSGWDDTIDEKYQEIWSSWCETMRNNSTLRVPRCLKPAKFAGIVPTLHVFTDASEKAYGVAVFAVYQELDERHCSLVFAKSRVAPLKTVTIPRLELTAAVLGARIGNKIAPCLGVFGEDIRYWTDSLIVFHYINNKDKRFSVFVSNRLTTIHALIHADQWRHTSSSDNAADITSRGCHRATELSAWMDGPSFLRTGSLPDLDELAVQQEPEGLKTRPNILVNTYSLDNSFDRRFSKFSSWTKILKSIAWLTRFKNYIRFTYGRTTRGSIQRGLLTRDETRGAEDDLLRIIQQQSFPNEYMSLNRTGRVSSKQSNIYRLSPHLESGLIKIRHRLSNDNSTDPILIQKNHWIADRLVMHFHRQEGHSGINHILSLVKERYWILGCRTLTKGLLRDCFDCRKINSRRQEQIMAPLAEFQRLPNRYPFANVGIDYFGHFLVKIGRRQDRRYGCLFTCLQTRAIHIEVTHSLTTDSFILALMRFIGRRGCPKIFYSDNGTNLFGATRELRAALVTLKQKKINDEMLCREIEWRFNPSNASHRGGAWERLIRSVRRVLCVMSNQNILTEESLSSLMIEAERVVNNRPLIPNLASDSEELALTPVHLLCLRSIVDSVVPPSISDYYHRQWQLVNKLADAFWKQWLNSYIPSMRERQKWVLRHRNISVGDIVLIEVDSQHRNNWPLGRVVKTTTSSDGVVRTVELKTANRLLTRDVRKLYLIEGSE